jgi:hypothetical protein
LLIYRVFPYLRAARIGQPGHPLYVHPAQGTGRWDNPHRPQWTLAALWGAANLTVANVEAIPRHPALEDAARSRPVVRDGI